MKKIFSYNSNEKSCPYWSAVSNYCLLNDDGLYLPFAEHVNIFCLTINYRVCPRLLDQCVLENIPSDKAREDDKSKIC